MTPRQNTNLVPKKAESTPLRSNRKSEHKNDSKGGNTNPSLQSTKPMKKQSSTKRKRSVKKQIAKDNKVTSTPTAAKSNLHLQIGKF